jgi:hypothetical protein
MTSGWAVDFLVVSMGTCLLVLAYIIFINRNNW